MQTYKMYNPRTQTTDQITVGYITPNPIIKDYTITTDKKATLKFLTRKKTVKPIKTVKKTVKREKPIIVKAPPKITPKKLICMELVYSKPYALSDNLNNRRIPKANRKDNLMELISPIKVKYPITIGFGDLRPKWAYRYHGKTKIRTIKTYATYKFRKVNGKMVRCEYPKNQLKQEFNPNTPIEKGSLRQISQFITVMVK